MLPLFNGDILAGVGLGHGYLSPAPGRGPLSLGPIVRLHGDPALRIISTRRSAGEFWPMINSLPRHQYICEATTNLVDWTFVQSATATGNTLEFRDATFGNTPARLFRVVKP